MGVIDFSCSACGWNFRDHMIHCPKCGSNPMKLAKSSGELGVTIQRTNAVTWSEVLDTIGRQ